jgi:hypothetical protein
MVPIQAFIVEQPVQSEQARISRPVVGFLLLTLAVMVAVLLPVRR